jgi:uncharacterized protein
MPRCIAHMGLSDLPYVASGFGIGRLVGLTGVGCGSLTTPLLVLIFGISPTVAVGTDLLFAAITKSVGALVHGVKQTLDWRITTRLWAGSLPGAALTLWLLYAFSAPRHTYGSIISTLLGVALILTAASILFRGRILALISRSGPTADTRHTAWLTIVTGIVVGVLVSLTSIGAGAIGMTALIVLYPRLPLARLVGSDIAHAVPLTLLAGAGHIVLGTVNWAVLGSLLLGSVPGIVAGS